MYACFIQFFCIFVDMVEVHFTKLYVLAFCSCFFTGISSKYDYIQKRVTHQSVSSVDSTCGFSCN